MWPVTVAQRCEALGYASLWSNDHPGASGLETVAVFGEAARRPALGVAVLALDRHAPADVAQKLDEVRITPQRLWLGIGAGFTKRPLGVVREGIAALREVLPKNVRIVVAAMGPKMCALAGAEADGVFLNWMTPEKARWAREHVHEGAREAGRVEPPPVFGYVRVAVGEDAEERLRKEEAFYRQLHQGYIRHFEGARCAGGHGRGRRPRRPRGRSPVGAVRRDRPHRGASARARRRGVARQGRRGSRALTRPDS